MMWQLDGYDVGPALGHGSAGTIVRGRDTVTGADVAIRYLASELSTSSAFMASFRADMTRLEVIEQANVGLVYELIERDGRAALVTEFIAGRSLAAMLRRGEPLPPAAAVYAAAGALTGLAALHDRGVRHGAVRPESVLVDPDGTVKLVDVGLAVPGRPGAYAAPEVQRGEPGSPSADVFGVFAVLHDCLAGGQYSGAGIPPALHVAFSVGLAVEPASRYPDAGVALAQFNVMAAAVFGPDWSTIGRQALAAWVATTPAAPVAPPPVAAPPVAAPPVPAALAPAPPASLPPLWVAPVAVTSVPAGPGPASPVRAPLLPARTAVPVPAAPPLPVPAQRLAPDDLASAVATGRPAVAVGGRSEGSLLAPAPLPSYPSANRDLDATAITPVVRPLTPTPTRSSTTAPADPPPPYTVVDDPIRHRRPRRGVWIAAALTALVLAAGGTAWAIFAAGGSSEVAPGAVTTNVRVPMPVASPTVPPATATGPNADTLTPATPAGLRVTGRSTIAVSLDWASSVDNVNVAGYVVIRDGRPIGTSYAPGFTDNGLVPETKYTYAVTAFDEAGNVSPASRPVTAVTLAEPDVSPPTIPEALRATGKSVNSIVLAWAASRDNVGVTGYEVYRDGTLVANTPQPGYTDTGLAPASSHRYTIRAYDSSNNASADSAPLMVTTLQAPDTSPPTTPTGLGAVGTGPTTIDISWQAAQDNVGVTRYQLFRDGTRIADVAGTTYTDPGLAPDTSYTYTVRAMDAANNASGQSGPATASTTSPPPPSPTVAPTTTGPQIMSIDLTATPVSDCMVHLVAVVTASAPTSSTLFYDVNGATGSIPLTFTNGDLTQTIALPDADASLSGGLATASAGGVSQTANWPKCDIDPSPTTEDSPGDTAT